MRNELQYFTVLCKVFFFHSFLTAPDLKCITEEYELPVLGSYNTNTTIQKQLQLQYKYCNTKTVTIPIQQHYNTSMYTGLLGHKYISEI